MGIVTRDEECFLIYNKVMRRLKIMRDDVPMACGDEFGTSDLQDRLKAFCNEEGMEMPRFWVLPTEPDGCLVCHAVSLHLKGKDNWEGIEANVVFVLKDFSIMENREAEANRLQCMFKELGEPVLLTAKVAERPDHQQHFYKSIGLVKTPVRWQDDEQNEYEVYVWGDMLMDTFAYVMEQVVYIEKAMGSC